VEEDEEIFESGGDSERGFDFLREKKAGKNFWKTMGGNSHGRGHPQHFRKGQKISAK
jgi:hypothetical protein